MSWVATLSVVAAGRCNNVGRAAVAGADCRAGVTSARSFGCGMQGTPQLRWRFDGLEPVPYMNS